MWIFYAVKACFMLEVKNIYKCDSDKLTLCLYTMMERGARAITYQCGSTINGHWDKSYDL